MVRHLIRKVVQHHGGHHLRYFHLNPMYVYQNLPPLLHYHVHVHFQFIPYLHAVHFFPSFLPFPFLSTFSTLYIQYFPGHWINHLFLVFCSFVAFCIVS